MKLGSALLAFLVGVPIYGQSRADDQAVARAAVSAEIAAISQYPIDSAAAGPYQPMDIELERVPGFPRHLKVWRASVPVDHVHPWLIAMASGRVFRLGGFQSVALLELDSVLAAATPNLKRRGRMLAKLADKYGADSVVYPADSGREGGIITARHFWEDGKPADWSPDTLIQLRDGRTVVSLTAVSQNGRSFGGEWHAFRYQFVFDKRRRLVGWSLVEQWPAAA